MSHGFFTFDFSSQSWSEAGLVGKPLLPRIHHMATCHEGSMVIVGGSMSLVSLHYQLACLVLFVLQAQDLFCDDVVMSQGAYDSKYACILSTRQL